MLKIKGKATSKTGTTILLPYHFLHDMVMEVLTILYGFSQCLTILYLTVKIIIKSAVIHF